MEQERDPGPISQVSSTSWSQRFGPAIGGVLAILAILVPTVIVMGSIVLLVWNEGRAITTAEGLSEGAGDVRNVSSDSIDSGNNGRLIHVSGTLTTGGSVTDPDFPVRSHGVRLVRHVEMYQWKEERRSGRGGGEEYFRSWSDKPIDSDNFQEGHANPPMPFQSHEVLAPGTRLGAYAVPDSLLRVFGKTRRIAASDALANVLQTRVDRPVTVTDGVLYVGRNPHQPATGDIRISFADVPLQKASVVAMQSGISFAPFRTHAGTAVELIEPGEVPAAVMFKVAEERNVVLTWILRAAGALAMLIGFIALLRTLRGVGHVIAISGAGTLLAALLCTVAIAPLAIALGWLWYRPLVGIAVLVVGGLATWGLLRHVRRRAASKGATA